MSGRQSYYTSDTSVGTDRYSFGKLGVERQISTKVWGSLYYERDSRRADNPQSNYVENSVSIEVAKHW